MPVERLQPHEEQDQQSDQTHRDAPANKNRVRDHCMLQYQRYDHYQQSKGKELASAEEKDLLVGEDGKLKKKEIVLSDHYNDKEHPGLAGGAGTTQSICTNLEALLNATDTMLNAADKLTMDPASKLVVEILKAAMQKRKDDELNKTLAAINGKLDQLINSPFQTASDLLEKANRLKESKRPEDITLRRDYLSTAARKFISASNKVNDGFIQTQSRVYAGVCDELLGTHDCAMGEYEKAYTIGHEWWNQSIKDLKELEEPWRFSFNKDKKREDIIDKLVYLYQYMEPIKRIVENSPSTSDNAASTSNNVASTSDNAVGGHKTLESIPGTRREREKFYASGEEHRQAGRYKKAIDDYSRVLALAGGNHAKALMNRGDAKRMLGDVEGALKDLNDSLKIEPNSAQALDTRGQVYQAMGQHEEALADFNRALALDSSLDWVKTTNAEDLARMSPDEQVAWCMDGGLAKALGPDGDRTFVPVILDMLYGEISYYERRGIAEGIGFITALHHNEDISKKMMSIVRNDSPWRLSPGMRKSIARSIGYILAVNYNGDKLQEMMKMLRDGRYNLHVRRGIAHAVGTILAKNYNESMFQEMMNMMYDRQITKPRGMGRVMLERLQDVKLSGYELNMSIAKAMGTILAKNYNEVRVQEMMNMMRDKEVHLHLRHGIAKAMGTILAKNYNEVRVQEMMNMMRDKEVHRYLRHGEVHRYLRHGIAKAMGTILAKNYNESMVQEMMDMMRDKKIDWYLGNGIVKAMGTILAKNYNESMVQEMMDMMRNKEVYCFDSSSIVKAMSTILAKNYNEVIIQEIMHLCDRGTIIKIRSKSHLDNNMRAAH